MADGLIIRRGGSGGGAKLNVINVFSANLLPTQAQNAKEDTIAVIASEMGNLYVQGTTPEAQEGDIWITPEDTVFDVNLAKTGSILISIGCVYQYTEGAWEEKQAYIFRDGKWQHVWNKTFYESGKLTGKVTHTEMLSPTTCQVTYGDSAIQCVTKAGSASEVYAVFGPVNLTDMTTLTANGTYPKKQDGTTYAILAVAAVGDASFTDEKAAGNSLTGNSGEYIVKDTVKANSAGKAFELRLDVTNLKGEWYVYVGTNTAGGKWTNTRYVNFTALKGA